MTGAIKVNIRTYQRIHRIKSKNTMNFLKQQITIKANIIKHFAQIVNTISVKFNSIP
jgi:hypothetical protein